MKSMYFKAAILFGLTLTALLRAELLNSYDFESGTNGWTIKATETGFMHGSASALAYVGNGGNTTNTLYIQDLNLSGGARDVAFSPQLNLAAHTGKAIKLSFDYLFQTFSDPGMEDTLKVVYRKSLNENWQTLIDKLPISDMQFVNRYLFLPQDLFVNGLQIGFAYQPAMGVGAALDNVKLELFSDMEAPQLVYTTGLVSSPETIHLALTVTDDSALPSTVEGSCTINGQTAPFTLNYLTFGTEKKYKATIQPTTPFIGEIPCSVLLKDEYNNSRTVEFTVKTMTGLNSLTEGLEGFTNFSNNIENWTVINKNRGQVWQLGDYSYPNTGSIPGFFVFNHQATTPAMPDSSFSHAGIKSLICMSSMSPPNDNWIVTPYLNYTGSGNASFSFWARSIQTTYGLDRFKVYYSQTGCDPSDFVLLAPQNADYLEAPLEWTQFSYTLPQSKGYLAIQSVSHDNFGLLVDDLYFGPETDIESPTSVSDLTLYGNYPNPFNPVTTISFNLPTTGMVNATVYNAKGELVKELINSQCTAGKQQISFDAIGLNSGLYFYRITAAGKNVTGKMMLLK